MCFPIAALGLAAGQTAMLAVTVAATAASIYGQQQSAKAQARATGEQNEQQAEQIAQARGQELHERARAARRERAEMRANASEAGINLGSNSFLAALQTSAMNQYNDQGLILQNEKSQQAAREAQARSIQAGLRVPSGLSAALTLGAAGVGAYNQTKALEQAGTLAATGGP